jgi:hypothetical protein
MVHFFIFKIPTNTMYSVFQDELDTAMEMWNAHSIRPVRNNYVPSGQPRIMYNFPCLWDCVD